ncbi:hypothetical protein DE146DRAFT_414402 [Phaeosphaeria sp. MPI-PUGE-AT-0046c]|nr:hypothetical protein DE146DRAFT_414402 [Phaeosphaeria sp. MPI-PUGE-AT-0046c]
MLISSFILFSQRQRHPHHHKNSNAASPQQTWQERDTKAQDPQPPLSHPHDPVSPPSRRAARPTYQPSSSPPPPRRPAQASRPNLCRIVRTTLVLVRQVFIAQLSLNISPFPSIMPANLPCRACSQSDTSVSDHRGVSASASRLGGRGGCMGCGHVERLDAGFTGVVQGRAERQKGIEWMRSSSFGGRHGGAWKGREGKHAGTYRNGEICLVSRLRRSLVDKMGLWEGRTCSTPFGINCHCSLVSCAGGARGLESTQHLTDTRYRCSTKLFRVWLLGDSAGSTPAAWQYRMAISSGSEPRPDCSEIVLERYAQML